MLLSSNCLLRQRLLTLNVKQPPSTPCRCVTCTTPLLLQLLSYHVHCDARAGKVHAAADACCTHSPSGRRLPLLSHHSRCCRLVRRCRSPPAAARCVSAFKQSVAGIDVVRQASTLAVAGPAAVRASCSGCNAHCCCCCCFLITCRITTCCCSISCR
jgi:hypothetical protein